MTDKIGKISKFSQEQGENYQEPSVSIDGMNSVQIKSILDVGRQGTFRPGPGVTIQGQRPISTVRFKNVGGEAEMRSVSLEKKEFATKLEGVTSRLAAIEARKDVLIKLLDGSNLREEITDGATIDTKLTEAILSLREQKNGGRLVSLSDVVTFEKSLLPLEQELDFWFSNVTTLAQEKNIQVNNLEVLRKSANHFIVLRSRFEVLSSKKIIRISEITALISSLEWLETDPSSGSPVDEDNKIDVIEKKLEELEILLKEENIHIEQEQRDLEEQERKNKEMEKEAFKQEMLEMMSLVTKVSIVSSSFASTKAQTQVLIPSISEIQILQALIDTEKATDATENEARTNPSEATLKSFQEKYDLFTSELEKAKKHVEVIVAAPSPVALDVRSGWPSSIKRKPGNGPVVWQSTADGTNPQTLDNSNDVWSRLEVNFNHDFKEYFSFITSGDTIKKRKEHSELIVLKNDITFALLNLDTGKAAELITLFSEKIQNAVQSWEEKMKKGADEKKQEDNQKSFEKTVTELNKKFEKLENLEKEIFPSDSGTTEPSDLINAMAFVVIMKKQIDVAKDAITQELLNEYKKTIDEAGALLGKEEGVYMKKKETAKQEHENLLQEFKREEEHSVYLFKAIDELLTLLQQEETLGLTTELDACEKIIENATKQREVTLNNLSENSVEDYRDIIFKGFTLVNRRILDIHKMATFTRERGVPSVSVKTILRSPLLIKAKEGQKVDTRKEGTILLNEHQNTLQEKGVTKNIERAERAEEKHQYALEQYEDMYIRNPKEYRKIYTYKTWLAGDPGKNLANEVLQKGYFEMKTKILRENQNTYDSRIHTLTMFTSTNEYALLPVEEKNHIKEAKEELRKSLDHVNKRIAKLETLPSDTFATGELTEKERIELNDYYDQINQKGTIEKRKEVYSPYIDSSLVHIKIEGQEMTRAENKVYKVALADKAREVKATGLDKLSSEDVAALVPQEVILNAKQREGIPNVYGGMTRSLTHDEAKKIKDSYSLETMDMATPNNELEKRTSLEKRNTSVSKVFTSVTRFAKDNWRAMLTMGLVSSAVAAGAAQADQVKHSTRPSTFGDVLKKQSYRTDLEKSEQIMSDVTSTGDRYFANFITKYAPLTKIDKNNLSIESTIAKLSCKDILTKPDVLGSGRDDEQRQLGKNVIMQLMTLLEMIKNPAAVHDGNLLVPLRADAVSFDEKTNTVEKLFMHVREVIAKADEEDRLRRL
jgi:hypothetical protein